MSASAREVLASIDVEFSHNGEAYAFDLGSDNAAVALAALSAAGFVIVPMEPTGDARAVLRYLRTQARNGTLHPQVVIQNADKVLGKQDA